MSLPVWESMNINPIMTSLKIQKTMKKNQTGENHVHQALSKVFVF